MPECLTLGGETTEMAIEDNSEATTALIATLTAQGETNELILEDVKQTIIKTETQLKLLNAKTEEAFNTKITEEDLENG